MTPSEPIESDRSRTGRPPSVGQRPDSPTGDDSTAAGRAYAAYPVRIGVQLQPQHATYAELRRAVAAAEEAGVDVVFNWDHFFPPSGDPDGLHFEAWTMLAAWAEATERVEVGTLVTCHSYRNADLLADMARTVDHIAPGRLVFGIGAGWFERDYTEYGYEFGTASARLDALGTALPRIRDRWARLNPPPTRDIPVLIGGGGERRTLKLAAAYADIWHGFGDAGTIAHKHDVLDAHCRALGRDPGRIERSAGVGGKTPDEAGQALLDAGTRLFTVSTSGPTHDLGLVRDWLAWRDDLARP